MTALGVAAVVFLGSLIGTYSVYSYPSALPGLIIFSLFIAGYAWFAGRIGAMAWHFIADVRRMNR